MDFRVVQATEEDWEWIAPRYARTAWESMSRGRQERTAFAVVRQNLRKQAEETRKAKGGNQLALVAWRGDSERAGFVWAIEAASGFTGQTSAWVMCVFVEEQARGHGLGRRLMTMAEEWAKEQGYQEIVLNVSVQHDRARRLYERMRYEAEMMHYRKRLQ